MPLVRIDVQEGRSAASLRRLADVVQGVMVEVFAAPPNDRYQIITEHPVGHIIAGDSGLGFERSSGVAVIHIFQQGRTQAQKVAAYEQLAIRLEARCDLRPQDLVVSVSANTVEDWSFGFGRAQFLTGEL